MGSGVCSRANTNGPGAWWLGCWIYKLHILHIEGLKGSYESFRITIQWSSRVHSMIVSPHRGTNIPARYGHEKAPVGSSVNLVFWGSTQTLLPQYFFWGGVGSLSCIWYILRSISIHSPAPRNHNREREGISWCGERERFKSFREGPWPPMKKRTAGCFGKLHDTKNSLRYEGFGKGIFSFKKKLLN